jgi:hypothetical protein
MIDLYITAMIEGVIICLLANKAYNQYAMPETKWYVKAIVLIGWCFGFFIIAILPLDIFVVSLTF